MTAFFRPIATFADLFCGIGGFHYAAAPLGLRCVFASENDEAARKQYAANFGITPAGDITQIKGDKVPDHDILFAGFPCQSFSIIGRRAGTDDSRGVLVFEIIRVLKEKRPTAFVLENVKQFSTLSGGQIIRQVLREIEQLGYTTTWKVLNALNFGLPQRRERVIIVGAFGGGLAGFEWPRQRKTYKPLAEILEKNPDATHYASARIQQQRRQKHQAKITPSIWHENKSGNISSHPFSCALRAGASHNYLLVDGERRPTPRELLRLQGFPERMRIIGTASQLRKQVGNAVPVPMAQAVIKQVIRHVEKVQAAMLGITAGAAHPAIPRPRWLTLPPRCPIVTPNSPPAAPPRVCGQPNTPAPHWRFSP